MSMRGGLFLGAISVRYGRRWECPTSHFATEILGGLWPIRLSPKMAPFDILLRLTICQISGNVGPSGGGGGC